MKLLTENLNLREIDWCGISFTKDHLKALTACHCFVYNETEGVRCYTSTLDVVEYEWSIPTKGCILITSEVELIWQVVRISLAVHIVRQSE